MWMGWGVVVLLKKVLWSFYFFKSAQGGKICHQMPSDTADWVLGQVEEGEGVG